MSNISDAISLIGSPTKLARAAGVSMQTVCFWRDGKRAVSPAKCVAIERVTGGQVTRKDLRPLDWWEIWPELAGDDVARVGDDNDDALREGAEFLALKRRHKRR